MNSDFHFSDCVLGAAVSSSNFGLCSCVPLCFCLPFPLPPAPSQSPEACRRDGRARASAAAARQKEDIDSFPRWPPEKEGEPSGDSPHHASNSERDKLRWRHVTICAVAHRSSHQKTSLEVFEDTAKEKPPRFGAVRRPLFCGGRSGGRPPPSETSLRRAGPSASPAFLSIPLTLVTMTNCTTGKTSGQSCGSRGTHAGAGADLARRFSSSASSRPRRLANDRISGGSDLDSFGRFCAIAQRWKRPLASFCV